MYLGITTTTMSEFLSAEEEEEEDENKVIGENVRKKSASQYSPSVSHDEEQEIEMEDDWEAFETVVSSKSTPDWSDEAVERKTEQFVTSTKSAPFMISSSKAMKLLKPGTDNSPNPQIQSTVSASLSINKEKTASKIRDNLKGRMCEEDIVRLETQLLWSQQETDMFADIEPEIPSTSRFPPPVQNTLTLISQEPNLSLQPQQEVEVSVDMARLVHCVALQVGGEWGDDGWDDF